MTPRLVKVWAPALALTVAVGVTLAGCDMHPRKVARSVPVIPKDAGPPDPNAAEDRLYADAVHAIEERDYATALDDLQLARDARPDDPRVFAALGVVYDKLGRFDLSTKYYDDAERLDPGSKVVAIDRAYSETLQRTHAVAASGIFTLAQLEAHPRGGSAAGDTIAAIDTRKIGRLQLKRINLTARLIRAGVLVFNATGDAGGADQARVYLARGGWSVGKGAPRVARTDPTSRIIYPSFASRLGKALAWSLPYRVKLTPCEDCDRLEIVVGRDLRSRLIAPRAPEVRRG
jgi:tetratricopeptide (TPR) repeat protein